MKVLVLARKSTMFPQRMIVGKMKKSSNHNPKMIIKRILIIVEVTIWKIFPTMTMKHVLK
jgi:hypothetical protein